MIKRLRIKKSVIRKRIFKTKKANTISIFAFGDNHGSKKILRKLKRVVKLRKITFVICVGDFTLMARNLELFLHNFNKLGVPFIFVHGNHEDIDRVYDYLHENYLKNIVFVHKNLIQFKNICITGFGGEGFSYKTPELERYAKILKQDVEADKDNNKKCKFEIFITHAPPFDTKIDELHNNKHCGNVSIRSTINLIGFDLAFCGHFHESFKTIDKLNKTTIINPGKDGAIITLDAKYNIKSIEFLKP